MSEQINLEALSQRIAAQMRRRQAVGLFIANLIIYVVFVLLAWIVFPRSGGNFIMNDITLVTMLMMTIGWGMGIGLHWVTIRLRPDGMAAQEQAIARELLRMVREGDSPKRKRHDRLMLTEDGELLEIETGDDLGQQQRVGR